MTLDELIDAFRGPLTGLLISWGASAADAETLAQDAFVTAYLQRERCRGDWSDPVVFGPWLRGIAKNEHRNFVRAARRRERHTREAAGVDSASDVSSDGEHAAVREAIDRLSDDLWTAVLMHYLEETPVRRVAELLGVPAKTVEGRLYRARVRLRELLPKPAVERGTP